MSEIYDQPERSLEPPEPVIVGTCEYCGDDIYDGDEVVEFSDVTYHRDCFMDCAPAILFDRYGAMASIAEKGDGYDG